jgi:protein-tyrosine phosphatase
MTPFWVQTKVVQLAIMPRPRGEDWLCDDIKLLKEAGVDIIVSALTLEEAGELGLFQEAECCQKNGIEFVSFPIEDRSVPDSILEFGELLDSTQKYLNDGRAVVVHCRAGIGRSSLIAACLLLRNGFSVESAFEALSEARGCPVPDTPEQRAWVERFVTRPWRASD